MTRAAGRTPTGAPEAVAVSAVATAADRLETTCGDGALVWHRWGEGPAVVLLHGGYGSWTHWLRNVEALADRHTVLAADLPGLGDSAMPPEPYDADSLGTILTDGLDALLGPSERYHLVGFSFGAALSGVVARIHGDRVRSVTVVGPSGLEPLREPIQLQSWRGLPDDEQRRVHRENLATLMLADPAAIDELAVRMQADNARRARLKSRPIARTPVLRDALAAIHGPFHVIYGERDPTIAGILEHRRQQLGELRPDVAVRIVPGAGHWVQFEAPAAFNATLLQLLSAAEAREARRVAGRRQGA